MSLETVVQDIREAARERADELVNEAEAEAEKIIDEAEDAADEIIAQAERAAEGEAGREREQRLSSATLEAKQARLAARRDVLEDVHEAVEEALADLEAERREALTRELLDAAVQEFEDANEVAVSGASADTELLESITADDDRLVYAGTVDCLGGVVVEHDDSRLRVNNTFDSLLETVWDEELREISERLFER